MQEVALLRKQLDRLTCREIGEALGRTTKQVKRYMYRRGITRPAHVQKKLSIAGALRGSEKARATNWKGGYDWRYDYSKNRHKWLCRQRLRDAIRSGKITRGDCERCGKPNAHAHHADYTKPFSVKWLCPKCHVIEHGGHFISRYTRAHGQAGEIRSAPNQRIRSLCDGVVHYTHNLIL